MFSILIDDIAVDDHIVSCGRIPHLKRDRIFQPLAGAFNMSLDSTQDTVEIEKDQRVLVKEDGIIRFSGYIKEFDESFDGLTLDLQIDNSLMKLKEFKLDYDTLHTRLDINNTDNQYKASDNSGNPNVAILWLMQNMFIKAGLALDVSNVEDLVYLDSVPYGEILYSDLVLDENMLYSLNQGVASNYLLIDSEPDAEGTNYDESKIDCLNFVQRTCIGFPFFLQPDDFPNRYVLYKGVSNNYVVSDDDKYSYKITKVQTDGGSDNYLSTEIVGDAVGGKITTVRDAYAGITFDSGDISSGTFTIVAHRLNADSLITFTSTGTLPAGLTEGTIYWVVNETTDTFQVSLEKGGTVIITTTGGTGTHSYYGEYSLAVNDRQGYGKFKVPYWNNLYVLFHEPGTVIGDVQTDRQLTTTIYYGGYSLYHIKPLSSEEITTSSLDYSEPSMLNHWLNIKDQTHTIKQAITEV